MDAGYARKPPCVRIRLAQVYLWHRSATVYEGFALSTVRGFSLAFPAGITHLLERFGNHQTMCETERRVRLLIYTRNVVKAAHHSRTATAVSLHSFYQRCGVCILNWV